MSRRLLLAWVVLATFAGSARAQAPFPSDLIPKRVALARLGLERHWITVVPLAADDHVLSISMDRDLLFAQTSSGSLHVYDSESGRPLWSARLGVPTSVVRPASANSFLVFATNQNRLFALDRRTGVTIWSTVLESSASASTAADEERVLVGTESGKLRAFALTEKVDDQKRIATRAVESWNWQTNGAVETRPVLAGKFVAFGSDDGRLHVALADERTMLYRIPTGGPIGAGIGTHGGRTLLVPSADHNLYAVDLFTSEVLWNLATGAPIRQEPLVAGDEVYVVNQVGHLSQVDAKTGSVRWTTSTQRGILLAIGAKKLYLESGNGDLFIVDRATGQVTADPQATLNRAGLNLRPYDLGITNRVNDRLYFATTSGMLVCLREDGKIQPTPLRDPKAPPFGKVPDGGVSLSPKAKPAPAPAEPPAEGTPPPDGTNPTPPEGTEPPPPADTPK